MLCSYYHSHRSVSPVQSDLAFIDKNSLVFCVEDIRFFYETTVQINEPCSQFLAFVLISGSKSGRKCFQRLGVSSRPHISQP